ncbi:MAG TPA: hypothetical protein VE777_13030 [Gaiellales bacterium]|jgi:hypothetical protein|nr:hypothetical protein [Gaiellales bacterium]
MHAPTGVTRRRLLAATAGGAVLTTMSPGDVEAAGSGRGRIAFDFVGKLIQDAAEFTGFGYLTRAAGFSLTALFTSPADQSEATARFTFFSRATLSGHSELHNLDVVHADGSLAIYHHSGAGTDFDDPESFARGTRIAAFAARYHSVVVEQTADQGSETLHALLRQRSARPFQVGGGKRVFGSAGLQLAIDANGWSQRISAVGPQSQAWIAGLAVPVRP